MRYSITIKIDGLDNRRRSGGLLHGVIGFFLLAKGTDYYQRVLLMENILPALPVFAVSFLSLAYGFFRRRFDPRGHYNSGLRLIQAATFLVLGVVLMPYSTGIESASLFIFAFVSVMLFFSERRVFEESVLYLEEEGVRIPGTYRDHLVPWNELTDVVVREDFITFFHADNKYLQYAVKQDLSTLEVAKMNAFCREKITGLKEPERESLKKGQQTSDN